MHVHRSRALLGLLLLLTTTLGAQNPGVIGVPEESYNFGIIAEEGGKVSHAFTLVNNAAEPLVITRVSVDCGCTTPSWTEEAIAPGDSTSVLVSYDPAGRPGTFIKYLRVYNNLTPAPVELSVKGNVSTRGTTSATDRLYQNSIGTVLVSNRVLAFPVTEGGVENVVRFVLNNHGATPVKVTIANLPPYLQINKSTFTLAADEPEELYLTTALRDGEDVGFLSRDLHISVQDVATGDVKEGTMGLYLPAIPRFVQATPQEIPTADLKTYVSLGALSALEQPALTIDLPIRNIGTAPLQVFAVDADDPALSFPFFSQRVEPGTEGKITCRVDTQLLLQEKRGLQGNVSLLMNDPSGPLRKIKLVINP